jgi:protein-L-isoaspartate(D-aspartate) O-methyltransferase
MPDFATLRRMMVDGQVRTSDVTDLRLQAAMLDLPREKFVPQNKAALAYLDQDITVTGPGKPARKLLKPMVLAKLIQAAGVGEGDRVLDVGCATGYSSVLLSRLAAAVVALEEDADLARQAKGNAEAFAANNVTVVSGTLKTGYSTGGPYDAILLEGATQVVPEHLHDQLKDGGRLVCVLMQGPAAKAMLYRSLDGEISGRPIFDASAPLLPGFAKTAEFVF